MVNEELLGYIKQQLSLNIVKETITSNLKANGWNDQDIGEAFAAISFPSSSLPNTASQEPFVATKTVQPEIVQSQNTAEQTIYTHPSRFNKKSISVVVILGFLLVAGASAYAYYTDLFFSLPRFKVEVMENIKDAKTVTFDINTNIDFSNIKDFESKELDPVFGGSSRVMSLNMKGSTDSTDSKNEKAVMVYNVNLGSLGAEFELRLINNIIYGSLTKAPVIPSFPMPMLSEYENKWFSSPLTTEDGEITDNSVPTLPGVGAGLIREFTPEQEERLTQILNDAHIVKNIQKLPSEKIGDQSSYHFVFDLDREGIIAYFNSMKDYMDTLSTDKSLSSELDAEALNLILDKIKDFRGEIWIGRKDKLVNKLALSFAVSPEDEKPEEKVKVNLVGLFNEWNQSVTIIAPEESTPFASLIEASLGDARQKGKDASIKANLSMMRAQAELFYDAHNNSYSGFCSSPELKTARKSIEDSGGTNFICKDKSQAYASGIKFSPTSLDKYWCVDSTGASRATATSPSGTVCPTK